MYNNRREKVSDTDLSGSKDEVPVQQYASNYFCKGRKCFCFAIVVWILSVLSLRKHTESSADYV